MPIISPTAISPHRIGGAKNWSSYWATLISATVENAAPTHVVLTFPVAKEDLVTTDFSVTIDGETSAISDATWVGVVLTLTIADTIVYGDTVIVTFEKSGGTKTVTNNTLADYYVRTDGSNTSPYDTPAKGANAIDTVMTYIHNNGDGSGAVVSIGEGTFSGANIYFQSANQDNVKVVGVSSTTTIIEVNNRVIYHTLADDIFVKRLTARTLSTTQEIYYAANEGKTITLKGVIFETPVSYNDYEIQNLGNNLNMYNCIFKGRGANRAQVYMRGGSNGYFYKCKSVANVGSPYNSIGWAMASTGTINIDHCNLLDFRTSGLIVSAGTVNVKNSIIAAGYKYASNQYSITRSAGTLTVSNCLVFGNIYYPETPINGEFTDGGGNVFINTNPKFKNYARKGYILPRVDDNGNSAYAANLGSLLAAKGFSGSFYIYGHNLTAPILVDLKTAISTGGMEIGCHSYSHSDISLTGKIFDVTKAAETITIDRTADSITLSGGGTVSGFKAKTLAVIKTELEGLGATVTAAAIYGAAGDGYITSNALGEVIAGGIAVNQIDLLIDNTAATGYYKSELADAKDLITAFINSDGDVTDPYTGVTYECRTYEAPYGNLQLMRDWR